MKERIAKLRETIIASDKAYDENKPFLTDPEYDALMYELIELERQYPEFADENSPTQKIYTSTVAGLEKVKHDEPMLSLKKAKTVPLVVNALKGEEVVASEKEDGLTIVLTFMPIGGDKVEEEGGKIGSVLVDAVSRGDGFTGERCLHTIRTIKNVPLAIPFKGKLVVRCECVLPYDEFERINVNGEYSNTRNLASGLVRQLSAEAAAKSGLKLIAFNLVMAEGIEFKTYAEQLEFLIDQGFEVVPHKIFGPKNLEAELKRHFDIYETEVRPNLNHGIDGMVVCINSLAKQEELGFNSKSPAFAVAYKFAPLEARTVLREIIWNTGKSGQLAPIGRMDPANIDGVEISRATLVHESYITEVLGLNKLPVEVILARAGDVIPRIVCKAETKEDIGVDPIVIPTVCPECGAPLVKFVDEKGKEGAHLFCTALDCKAQVVGKMIYYASRDALNIDGLGDKTIETLYDAGFLESIPSLYSLDEFKSEIIKMDGFDVKKVDKILVGIEKTKTAPLSSVLHGLSIRLLGSTSSKDLAKAYPSLEALMKAAMQIESLDDLDGDAKPRAEFVEELTKIKDFGRITAESVASFFQNPINQGELMMLKRRGLQMTEPVQEVKETGITGKTFVITGTLSIGRNEMKAKLESMGCKVSGSVSKKTDFLLMGSGEEGSSKHLAAIDLGVKIISEDELNNMI